MKKFVFLLLGLLFIFFFLVFMLPDRCGEMGYINQSGNCEYE